MMRTEILEEDDCRFCFVGSSAVMRGARTDCSEREDCNELMARFHSTPPSGYPGILYHDPVPSWRRLAWSKLRVAMRSAEGCDRLHREGGVTNLYSLPTPQRLSLPVVAMSLLLTVAAFQPESHERRRRASAV